MGEVIEQIAEVCRNDSQLREIVHAVAQMSLEEKNVFGSKVRKYFLNKTGEVDVEAYKFYSAILEGDNSRKILRLIEENQKNPRQS